MLGAAINAWKSLNAAVAKSMFPIRQPKYSRTGFECFSADFQRWLQANGFGDDSFARSTHPRVGGRTRAGEAITRTPVVLFHGSCGDASQWQPTLGALREAGYQNAEVFAYSWGDVGGNELNSRFREGDIKTARRFLEAVLRYTGANQIDIIGHSMGVPVSSAAIVGGRFFDSSRGFYDVGSPLTNKVRKFINIAGSPVGTMASPWTQAGNLTDGLGPYSLFVNQLRAAGKPAQRYVTLTSLSDPTAALANLTATGKLLLRAYSDDVIDLTRHAPNPFTAHFAIKDNTATEQVALLQTVRPPPRSSQ